MRPDNYLLKYALRLQKPKYSKMYMTVITVLVVSVYAYGYYLSWAAFEAEL